MSALYMSLVGARAWLIIRVPSICVNVAFPERQTKAPLMGHVRKANGLLRWKRRNCARLGVWFRRLHGPLRLVTISDSAFKAQDYQGVVMRGCVIILAEARATNGGESSHTRRSSPNSEVPALGLVFEEALPSRAANVCCRAHLHT